MSIKEPRKRKYSGDSDESDEKDNKKKNLEDIKKVKKNILQKLHREITKEVTYNNAAIKYNTPTIIYYNNREFKINTRKYYEQYEATWKCRNFRRSKDKPVDQKYFCNAGIKGIRDALSTNKYKFFLLQEHSENCLNIGISKRKEVFGKNQNKYKGEKESNNNLNNIESGINTDNIQNNDNINLDNDDGTNLEVNNNQLIYLDNNIIDKANKCCNASEIDNLIFNVCKKNKELLSKSKIFSRTFKKLYTKIKLKDNHLKYIYNKFKKMIFPETLDEIFEYSKNVEDLGYFCRNISKCLLLDNNGNIIEHSHIIFFTEIMIKRIIISENLLIDGTFTYPKSFYQTIIIMFYDPICFKMIPGIFIAINNKTLEGYNQSFKYIRDYIYNYVKNDLSKIKWKMFTTDFEYSLYTSFKNIFNRLENLNHKGCFFHYLKNIRKYLVKNGFTTKKKLEDYKYIIDNCYKLPFKKNIEKNIEKEIKMLFKKNKIYNHFLDYFNNQWVDYFKNKTLCLENINIKFRTTNSLENFNRIFKNEFNQKGEIENALYIDTLITLYKEQNEYFQKEIERQPKEKKRIIRKKEVDSNEADESINMEIENILKELDDDKDSENKSEESNFIISNSSSSKDDSDNLNDIQENLNKKKGFKWDKNSCSFDSFISIFIHSILPLIKDIIKDKKIKKKFTKNFELYLKFINHIIDKYINKEMDFYEIYENFNKDNDINLFSLQENEKYEYVPAIINYRPLINIDIFIIKYRINHFCTGKCKFSLQPIENLNSTPYIDIPLISYEDNRIRNIEELFNNYIYININTICQEEKCVNENVSLVNWYIKKYEILEMPLILSINININEYNQLNANRDFINKIFLKKVTLYNYNYNLIGFITQPSSNHYIGYFQNFNSKYSKSLKKWFKFNDMKGYFSELNNPDLSLDNIRSSETVALFIYLKEE